jgi:hypothetical protein
LVATTHFAAMKIAAHHGASSVQSTSSPDGVAQTRPSVQSPAQLQVTGPPPHADGRCTQLYVGFCSQTP